MTFRIPVVLLVEEHEDQLAMHAITLLAAGFHPLTAKSATEAFALACTFQPAAVVADAMLPGESGVTLTRWLREDDRTKQTAIIILASDNGSDTARQATAAGCDRVAFKPCPPDILAATIHTLLRNKAATP